MIQIRGLHLNKPVKLGFDNWVSLEEDAHRYFDLDGLEYKSMSRVLGNVKEEFDSNSASLGTAKSNLGKGATREQVRIEQKKVLAMWEANKNASIDHGNFIHNNLEKRIKTGLCDPIIEPVWNDIVKELGEYHRIFSEVILYNTDYMFAGTTDLVTHRYNGRTTNVYDFYDFKTNLSKGIYYHSMSKKEGKVKHYNRYFLDPVSYMEDCNYNFYALQLSSYAYMAELKYGIKVGRLSIIFISPDHKVTMIPVNYLRMEIKAIFDKVKSLKPILVPNKDVPVKNVISGRSISLNGFSKGWDASTVKSTW